MKRWIAGLLAALCCLSLSGCTIQPEPNSTLPPAAHVSLQVVTSFGGDDGNRLNYEAAVDAYELASGNVILDASESSSEEWKSKVMQDFETGNEPDVLFYFCGGDASGIISAGLVVPVDEIQAEYPEYGSNIRPELLSPSSVDGKAYSLPVTSYTEALFVNQAVLDKAGVKMPGADYTWDQFLLDCEAVKNAGYVPIAVSLQEVPHYLFEYAVYNEGQPDTHALLPIASDDSIGQSWTRGLRSIEDLYDRGFFPGNTLTIGGAEAVQLLADGKAAFLFDGTWQLGFFQKVCGDHLEDIGIAYAPGSDSRQATDMIGGVSMGYYITRSAWNNPKKRDAAIRFIEYMTSDAVASTFAASSGTSPLVNSAILSGDLNPLQEQTMGLIENATSLVPAVQDMLSTEARGTLFTGIKSLVTGRLTPEAVVDACMSAQYT